MIEIKNHGPSRAQTINVKDVIGRHVIAKTGEKIGKIRIVHINPDKLIIEGITVDKPGLTEDNYIGRDYIKTITSEGAILKITPLTEYLDKKVLDAAGKKVGKIKEIRRSKKTNKIISINVKKGLLKEDLVVPARSIASINHNVILKYNVANP